MIGPEMSGSGFDERFRPLRPASGLRLAMAFVFGPLAWLIGLVVVSVVIDRTAAIGIGLLVAGASFVVSAVVLSLLQLGRRREQRRYDDRA
jgi:Flp pilus assembly protein TadB